MDIYDNQCHMEWRRRCSSIDCTLYNLDSSGGFSGKLLLMKDRMVHIQGRTGQSESRINVSNLSSNKWHQSPYFHEWKVVRYMFHCRKESLLQLCRLPSLKGHLQIIIEVATRWKSFSLLPLNMALNEMPPTRRRPEDLYYTVHP